MDYYSSLYCIYRQPVLKIQNFCRRIRENQPNAAEVRLIGYWPTGVFRFVFEGLQHVRETSLMIFIDRAIGSNDDHARQARRAKGPEGFAVWIDKR